MKSILLCCICFCPLSTKSNAQVARDAGDSSHVSPEFNFVTLSGQQVFSANLIGKVIVLDFWSTDCNPCRKSMPQMEDFYRRYKNNPRVAVYLVNSGWETIEKARAFASSKRSSFLFFSWGTKYDLPFAYDNASAMMKAFNLDSNPSTIIIDARFQIRVKYSGYIEKFYDFLLNMSNNVWLSNDSSTCGANQSLTMTSRACLGDPGMASRRPRTNMGRIIPNQTFTKQC